MYKVLSSASMRRLIEIISAFLGKINGAIPKSSRKVLIFNSKEVYLNNYSMYKYLIQNNFNDKYKIYYSMPNISNAEGSPPRNVYFVKGLFITALLYLTCSVCFLDNSSIRIKPSSRQKVINLWHGTPLKRIGFMSKSADKNLPRNQMNSFNYMLVPSENFVDIYKESFNLSDNQIFISGQPRLDQLFSSNSILEKIGIDKNQYNKVIMWLTTYRVSYDNRLIHTSNAQWSETNLPIIKTLKEATKLNEYLEKLNILLLVKIHHGSVFAEDSIRSLSNLKILKDCDFISKDIQLYEILSQCDGLVTDFSSVYYDYLLLNRPIVFITEDIEDYDLNNGFVFENPLNYMPGDHVKTFEELILSFERLVNDEDDNSALRENIKNYANKYDDDRHSLRILTLAGIGKY